VSGRLIYLVGPSEAGKDTLLRWIREHAELCPRLHVVRRTITWRGVDPSEAHEVVDVQ
jgi:ribose 1,5-bisphosphokinase PhnN